MSKRRIYNMLSPAQRHSAEQKEKQGYVATNYLIPGIHNGELEMQHTDSIEFLYVLQDGSVEQWQGRIKIQ